MSYKWFRNVLVGMSFCIMMYAVSTCYSQQPEKKDKKDAPDDIPTAKVAADQSDKNAEARRAELHERHVKALKTFIKESISSGKRQASILVYIQDLDAILELVKEELEPKGYKIESKIADDKTAQIIVSW